MSASVENISDSDRKILEVLQAAVEKTMRAYQKTLSKNDLEAWEAARNGLVVHEVNLKGNEQHAEPDEISVSKLVSWSTFKDTVNRADVRRFLLDAGYQVAERTFYRHCDSGLLSKNDKGFYTRRLVKKYAETNLTHVDPAAGKGGDLAMQKQKSDIARIDIINERERWKLDKEQKKYIARSLLGQELAARTVILDNGVRNLIHTKALEWIVLVGGDRTKVSDLIDAILEHWDKHLNKYANLSELEVIFEPEEE